MNSNLQKILRKVESVQRGILRVEDQNNRLLLQARAGSDEERLNCIVDPPASQPFEFRQVNLIQKDKKDYLFITCEVREQARHKQALVMSMEILRAAWFTRRTRGSTSWLQQKCAYVKAS